MIFLRNYDLSLRETSFSLMVPASTLNSWNKEFDDNMQPVIKPDKRGKTGKVTLNMVRKIVEVAKHYKNDGKRVRLKSFTRMLAENNDIFLSHKTVGDILTANNLRSPQTRQKRPGFYQQVRQKIPNGLVSVDGSEIKIQIDDQMVKLNLEMAVDTNTFTHTAFSISESETSEEFIKVVKAHCREWGIPIGLVCDSGSANLSEASMECLDQYGIKPIPAGPGNPKGNGSIEGAFSQLKKIMGFVHIDTSTPVTLARSVLHAIVSIYIKMRNKLPLSRDTQSPAARMTEPTSKQAMTDQKQKIQNRINQKKKTSQEDQRKYNLLHGMIRTLKISAEESAIKQAEKSIKFYNMESVFAAQKAFIKAVNRKRDRLNLSYFFGILKRIQQEQDDQAYQQYCQSRYNYNQMQEQMADIQKNRAVRKSSPVQNVLNILVSAFTARAAYLKNMALRRAEEWTTELANSTKYAETLRKKFENALVEMPQLESSVKDKILTYIDESLEQKVNRKSVTQFS